MSVLIDRVFQFDVTSEWLPRHSFDQCANQEESILQNTTASEIQVLDMVWPYQCQQDTKGFPNKAHLKKKTKHMFFQSFPSKSLQVSLSMYPHLASPIWFNQLKSGREVSPDLKALWRTDSLPVLCQWTSRMPFPAWMWGGHQVQTIQTSTWTWGCELLWTWVFSALRPWYWCYESRR